jgi:hypothetical protein
MNSHSMTRRCLAVAAAAMAASACAGPTTPINATLKEFPQNVRIADAQTDVVAAPLPPSAPALTGGPIAPPTFTQVPHAVPSFPPPPRLPTQTCAPATAAAHAAVPAGNGVQKAPAVAAYTYRTSGKHTAGGANAGVTDYPATGQRQVGRAVDTTGSGPLKQFDYQVLVTLGSNRTLTTYRVVPQPVNDAVPNDPAPGLYVAAIQTFDSAGKAVSTFKPSPPMTVVPFPAKEGATFKVASVDTSTGVSVSYDGTVGKQKEVDACGTIIDTREVAHKGTISVGTCGAAVCNSAESKQTMTSSFSATYDLAFQYGGLSVQDHIHVDGVGLDAPYTDDLTGVISTLPAEAP